MMQKLGISLATLSVTACSSGPEELSTINPIAEPQDNNKVVPADFVFTNARVYTALAHP